MMKRRDMLIRSFTAAVSASVFAASGWLMGTRSLTMNPAPPFGTKNQVVNCTGGIDLCGPDNCAAQPFCRRSLCSPNCAFDTFIWYKCQTNPPCSSGFCRLEIVYGDCVNNACTGGPYCS
jgi:hypothetical protein